MAPATMMAVRDVTPRWQEIRARSWARLPPGGYALALCVAGLACRQPASPTTQPVDAPAPAVQPPEVAEPVAYDTVVPAPEPEPEATEPGAAAPPRPPKTIFRRELKRAIGEGPGYLLYQLGPEPFRASGTFVGWEITKLFPDDPHLCDPGCDLQVGDVILSVNGDRLETPQAFSNMVARASTLDTLKIRSLRDEQRRVVTYRIVDG